MPSVERPLRTAGAVLAVLTLVYALAIAGQILLGVIVAGMVYGTAFLVSAASSDGVVAEMGRPRAVVTGVVAVGVVAYSLVVVGRVLLGLFVAIFAVLLSWLTAPSGPLARFIRWLLAARDDLREVRDAVVSHDAPSGDD